MKHWLIITILLCLVYYGYTQKGHINRPKQNQLRHTPKVGSRIRLQCKVSGAPKPFVAWFLNDTRLSFKLYKRYRLKRNMVIIDKVSLSDSGYFSCRAENRFGHYWVNHTVKVRGSPSVGKPTRPTPTAISQAVLSALKAEFNKKLEDMQHAIDEMKKTKCGGVHIHIEGSEQHDNHHRIGHDGHHRHDNHHHDDHNNDGYHDHHHDNDSHHHHHHDTHKDNHHHPEDNDNQDDNNDENDDNYPDDNDDENPDDDDDETPDGNNDNNPGGNNDDVVDNRENDDGHHGKHHHYDKASNVHVHLSLSGGRHAKHKYHHKDDHHDDNEQHDDNHHEDAHAHCELMPNSYAMPEHYPYRIHGSVHLSQDHDDEFISITMNASGCEPGEQQHGFHVHSYGDMSKCCESLGKHYNPGGHDHGAPDAEHRHVGDFGNFLCQGGNILQTKKIKGNLKDIIGRSFALHEREDDMGQGHTDSSRAGGDAGAKVACCVIGLSNPASHADDIDDMHKHDPEDSRNDDHHHKGLRGNDHTHSHGSHDHTHSHGNHDHDHSHGRHDHDHSHGRHDHDHSHGRHDHDHSNGSHDHDHSHGRHDHDHSNGSHDHDHS